MKKILFLPFFFLVIVAVGVVPSWADFLAGEDAYLREDYEGALEEWQPLARGRRCRGSKYVGLYVSIWPRGDARL